MQINCTLELYTHMLCLSLVEYLTLKAHNNNNNRIRLYKETIGEPAREKENSDNNLIKI